MCVWCRLKPLPMRLPCSRSPQVCQIHFASVKRTSRAWEREEKARGMMYGFGSTGYESGSSSKNSMGGVRYGVCEDSGSLR